jgi:hypothetical protein
VRALRLYRVRQGAVDDARPERQRRLRGLRQEGGARGLEGGGVAVRRAWVVDARGWRPELHGTRGAAARGGVAVSIDFERDAALGYLCQVGPHGSIVIPARFANHLLTRGLVASMSVTAPKSSSAAGSRMSPSAARISKRKHYRLTDKGEDARARMLHAATIEHADTEPPEEA